jgi:hypothetical protein
MPPADVYIYFQRTALFKVVEYVGKNDSYITPLHVV